MTDLGFEKDLHECMKKALNERLASKDPDTEPAQNDEANDGPRGSITGAVQRCCTDRGTQTAAMSHTTASLGTTDDLKTIVAEVVDDEKTNGDRGPLTSWRSPTGGLSSGYADQKPKLPYQYGSEAGGDGSEPFLEDYGS